MLMIISAFLLKYILFFTKLIMDDQELQETVNKACRCILDKNINRFGDLPPVGDVTVTADVFVTMPNTLNLGNENVDGKSVKQIMEYMATQ